MSENLNFHDFLNVDLNDMENITYPSDVSREESNEGTNGDKKALKKIEVTNKLAQLQHQTQSNSKFKITKELFAQVATQKEKHIRENKEFFSSTQLKLPDEYFKTTDLGPEPAFSDEFKKIIESIPLVAWGVIFVFLSLLVYLSVDAFRDFLIAVGICVLTCYFLNTWLSKVKIETVAERNTSKDITIKAINEVNSHAISQLDNNVQKSHALTLQTVENVQNIRADVEKFHIKTVDIMHERETEKDKAIQQMTQIGITERVKLNMQAAREIATIKSNTEITVKNIDAETERGRTKANQEIEGKRLKNILDIKHLETKTQHDIKQLEINFQTIDANLKADVDKTRVNAEKETVLAKERYETERYQIGQNADVAKVQSSHAAQMEESRQQTARIQAQQRNKKGGCVIS